MEILWILFVVELEIFMVKNYIITNETYDETEILSVDDDGILTDKEIYGEEDDYNLEQFKTDYQLEKKLRLLDFEEKYVKPNIKHNNKLYKKDKLEKKKRQSNPESDAEYTFRYATDEITTAEYDYDKFKQEYDHDVDELKKFEAKLNDSEFQLVPKPQCTGFFNKGPSTMMCLIREYNSGETEAIREEARKSILGLLQLWGIFLALFVIVGWGHCGYCNWICPTKHCFPEDGYEEVKQTLALNPPGSIMKKIARKIDDKSKTKFEKEYYKPSETEYYLYNSIWSDIYHV